MKKIKQIAHVSNIVCTDALTSIAEYINKGYEILQCDTDWIQSSDGNVINLKASIICILVQYE